MFAFCEFLKIVRRFDGRLCPMQVRDNQQPDQNFHRFHKNSRKNNRAELFHECSHFENFLRKDDFMAALAPFRYGTTSNFSRDFRKTPERIISRIYFTMHFANFLKKRRFVVPGTGQPAAWRAGWGWWPPVPVPPAIHPQHRHPRGQQQQAHQGTL